jgi:hypothetical protein
VEVGVLLELVRNGQNKIVVVEIAADLRADWLRIEWSRWWCCRRRRSGCATGCGCVSRSAATTTCASPSPSPTGLRLELVLDNSGGVPRLRVQAYITGRCWDVHVEIFEQFVHPAYQLVTAPLTLYKLEGQRAATTGALYGWGSTAAAGTCTASATRRCVSRCSTSSTSSTAVGSWGTAATRAAATRGQACKVNAQFPRFQLHVKVEKGRRLSAKTAAAAGWTCANRFETGAELPEFGKQLWGGVGINTYTQRRQLYIAIELEGSGDGTRILFINTMNCVEDHGAVFDCARHWSYAVLRPCEYHSAVAAYPSEGGSQRAQSVFTCRGND